MDARPIEKKFCAIGASRKRRRRYCLASIDKPAVAMLLKPESTIDAVAVAAELRKDRDYVQYCRAKARKKTKLTS